MRNDWPQAVPVRHMQSLMIKERPILHSWLELEILPCTQSSASQSVVVVLKLASMKSADFVVPAESDTERRLFREFHWAVRNELRIRGYVGRKMKQMPKLTG